MFTYTATTDINGDANNFHGFTCTIVNNYGRHTHAGFDVEIAFELTTRDWAMLATRTGLDVESLRADFASLDMIDDRGRIVIEADSADLAPIAG